MAVGVVGNSRSQRPLPLTLSVACSVSRVLCLWAFSLAWGVAAWRGVRAARLPLLAVGRHSRLRWGGSICVCVYHVWPGREFPAPHASA